MTLVTSFLLVAGHLYAGGPLTITGPSATTPGQPFVWNVSTPIQYTVDTGPLSVNPSGQTINDNSIGLALVQSMFQNWSSVPTTAIQFKYGGPISVPGVSGGDVKTIQDFDLVTGSCKAGTQSPVIFDANGSLIQALGMDPLVIGFTMPCKLDSVAGQVQSAMLVLNGKFQDGVNNPATNNYEILPDQFDEAVTHEMGHFSGLDHSQINLDLYQTGAVNNCNVDKLAGLPLMFPVEFCQSRKSAGLPMLAPDDMAWISKLYPNSTYAASYGTISGFVLFSDGITQVQGLNVIARRVDDPSTPQNESERIAFSVVSGFLFTGNPGQSITGDNVGGSSFGSRNPAVIGYYEIPVTPGTYTVQTENIDVSFTGESGVGPLDRPAVTYGGDEYWHHYESAYDNPAQKDPITVLAGQKISNVNFILNSTPPRFDPFEDGETRLHQIENPFVFRPSWAPWQIGALT